MIKQFVNWLYEAINHSDKRRYIKRIVADSKFTLNSYTRSNAMALARWAYNNDGFTRGAVDIIARYAVGTGITPQAQTSDEAWNESAEAYFNEASKVIDITGKHTLSELAKMYSRCIDVDGDLGIILTESESGFPQIQTVLGHRIGNGKDSKPPEGMYDGVQLNKFGRPVFYRVIQDDDSFVDVPAQNFIHLGEATRPDEIRCMTNLVHALHNIQDIIEIIALEKHGVKVSLSPSLVQYSESQNDLTSISEGVSANLSVSDLESGIIPKLGIGDKLESFKSNRPTPGIDTFFQVLAKPVAHGLGLPLEFVWNLSLTGGATTRLAIAQAQRRFEERQRLLVDRLFNRLYGWVISKGIKNGDLKQNPEWWRVQWQMPQRITVDVGRESQQNRQDIKMGMRTLAEDYAERGRDWREEVEQRAIEAQFIQAMAEKYGVNIDRVQSLFPNQTTQTQIVDTEERL